MSRIVLMTLIVSAFLITGPALNHSSAADGKAVFESLHCGACHKPDQKTKGESLPNLTKAYQSQENLVKFFKGEGKPILETPMPAMMEKQMDKLKALSDDDKKALADYILTFK